MIVVWKNIRSKNIRVMSENDAEFCKEKLGYKRKGVVNGLSEDCTLNWFWTRE